MATKTICPQCGAEYDSADDSCTARWHALLALDHSRRSPWGPLHGLAFATYALQHPDGSAPNALGRAWESLERIVGRGEDIGAVFARFRARPKARDDLPEKLRAEHAPRGYSMTIADLGNFGAQTYESRLRAWAACTYASWKLMLN